eukprot:scaffold72226_cov30-Attheya_sp.AAC.1
MSSLMMLRLSWMGCMLLSTFVSSVPMVMVPGSPALRSPTNPKVTDVTGRGDDVAAVDDAATGVISLKMVTAADDAETMRIGSEKEEEKKFEDGGAPTISEEGDNRVAVVDDVTARVITFKMVAAADDAETMRIGSEKEEEKKFEGGGAPTISEEGDNM